MKKNSKEEMVVLYNSKNEKIKGYYDRYQIPKDKGFYYAINIWLITNTKKIIIQKRSSNKKIYPNKFECIAGGVVKDESVLNACVREAKEELGINLNESDLIKIDLSLDEHHCYFMHTFICFVNESIVKDIKINFEEISEIKIINFKKLNEMIDQNLFADSIKKRFQNYKKIIETKIDEQK
ncbi:MAG: NUDIX domain-containing protein [Malacoplasma sp.]|nr:NUDIX domain-containing protein [Malacoplasma sp.]